MKSNMLVEGAFVAVHGSEGTQHIPVEDLSNPKDRLEIAGMYKGLDVHRTQIVEGFGLQIGIADWVYFPDANEATAYLEKEFGTEYRPMD
jgi:hypothetical protein